MVESQSQKTESIILYGRINVMDNADFIVGRLHNFDELQDFYCGEPQMDEFIHGNLKECSINHYCATYCVRDAANSEIAAIFSLSFDSVDI